MNEYNEANLPTYEQLMRNTKKLKEMMLDFNKKVLTDPAYAGQTQTVLDRALRDVRSYLSARDLNGQDLYERTQRGQAEYKEVQALAERIQRANAMIQWKQEEDALRKDCEKYEDPQYRELKEKQLGSKQNLYELAQKTDWTEADRRVINQEIATLVAGQKLEVEYMLTGNTDGPMWDYQRSHGDLVPKIAAAIREDAAIQNFTGGLDPEKLMAFVSGKGERASNLTHTKELIVERTASAKQTDRQKTTQNEIPEKENPRKKTVMSL